MRTSVNPFYFQGWHSELTPGAAKSHTYGSWSPGIQNDYGFSREFSWETLQNPNPFAVKFVTATNLPTVPLEVPLWSVLFEQQMLAHNDLRFSQGFDDFDFHCYRESYDPEDVAKRTSFSIPLKELFNSRSPAIATDHGYHYPDRWMLVVETVAPLAFWETEDLPFGPDGLPTTEVTPSTWLTYAYRYASAPWALGLGSRGPSHPVLREQDGEDATLRAFLRSDMATPFGPFSPVRVVADFGVEGEDPAQTDVLSDSPSPDFLSFLGVSGGIERSHTPGSTSWNAFFSVFWLLKDGQVWLGARHDDFQGVRDDGSYYWSGASSKYSLPDLEWVYDDPTGNLGWEFLNDQYTLWYDHLYWNGSMRWPTRRRWPLYGAELDYSTGVQVVKSVYPTNNRIVRFYQAPEEGEFLLKVGDDKGEITGEKLIVQINGTPKGSSGMVHVGVRAFADLLFSFRANCNVDRPEETIPLLSEMGTYDLRAFGVNPWDDDSGSLPSVSRYLPMPRHFNEIAVGVDPINPENVRVRARHSHISGMDGRMVARSVAFIDSPWVAKPDEFRIEGDYSSTFTGAPSIVGYDVMYSDYFRELRESLTDLIAKGLIAVPDKAGETTDRKSVTSLEEYLDAKYAGEALWENDPFPGRTKPDTWEHELDQIGTSVCVGSLVTEKDRIPASRDDQGISPPGTFERDVWSGPHDLDLDEVMLQTRHEPAVLILLATDDSMSTVVPPWNHGGIRIPYRVVYNHYATLCSLLQSKMAGKNPLVSVWVVGAGTGYWEGTAITFGRWQSAPVQDQVNGWGSGNVRSWLSNSVGTYPFFNASGVTYSLNGDGIPVQNSTYHSEGWHLGKERPYSLCFSDSDRTPLQQLPFGGEIHIVSGALGASLGPALFEYHGNYSEEFPPALYGSVENGTKVFGYTVEVGGTAPKTIDAMADLGLPGAVTVYSTPVAGWVL